MLNLDHNEISAVIEEILEEWRVKCSIRSQYEFGRYYDIHNTGDARILDSVFVLPLK